ncbi:MAG TPA: hypothetical protein ENK67_08165 [Flavobacteriia bacterium]|nr:hypothetical protein [Flavobacteriia bacterium]
MFRKRIIIFICLFILEYTYSQELSANKIIQKVIENKAKNDIFKALHSFEYKSYNKLIFSADANKVEEKLDTVFDADNKIIIDSTNYLFKKELAKQHFYISEKIAKHQFKNKHEKETVLLARMGGFKEPIYEFLALGIQNISFYKDKFSLLVTDYVSPIAKKAFKNYAFNLVATPYDSKIYIVNYHSINRKKSVGLQGALYIDKKTFAITKGIASVKGKIDVEAIQHYKYLEDLHIWFPQSNTIILRKGSSKKSVKAFRKLIGYKSNIQMKDGKNPEDISFISINSNNFDIKINTTIPNFKGQYSVTISKQAIKRNQKKWRDYGILLSDKEKNTYRFLDSLVKKHKVEKKIRNLRTLASGHFPAKYLDIDLSNVINFNNHEGFRLGFGGTTNDNISKYFNLTGYVAYGNKDHVIKYKYGGNILLSKLKNSWVGGSYSQDIFEAGKTNFLFEDSHFSLINPRNINISQFYSYKKTEAHISYDISSKLESKLQLDFGKYKTTFNYTFISLTRLLNEYNLTNLTLAFNWSPLSKFMKTPKGKFTVKKAFPIITTQITKSFDNVLDGDFNYLKSSAKIAYQLKTIKSGSTEILMQLGYIYGEAPLSHLYNHTPNYSLFNPWRRRINLSGTNAFETMLFNEFISDKFVSFQARQNFEKFRIGKKFKPKLSLITRFAFGDIRNPTNHQGVVFKRMNKGYFESGIVLNQLFKGFGLAGFYRYGAYQFPKFSDNVALKITFVLPLF